MTDSTPSRAAQSARATPGPGTSEPPASTPDAPTPRLGIGPLGIGIRVVAVIGILFAAQVVSMPIALLFQSSPSLLSFLEQPSWPGVGLIALLQGSVCALVVVGAWLWMRFVERRGLRTIGMRLSRSSLLWLLLGTATAAGLLIATRLLLPETGPSPGASPGADEAYAQIPLALIIAPVLIQAFVLQGFPEELLFRGVLLGSLRSRPMLAIVVSTLAFTVIHLVSNGGQQSLAEHFLYLTIPLGFALLAVGLVLWTRSLWSAVGVHGGFHVGNAIAFALLPEVDRVLSWVAIGGVQAVVGVVLIVLALGRGRRIPGADDWR